MPRAQALPAGEVGQVGVLGPPPVLEVGHGGDGVVAVGGPLPVDVVTDVVHALHGYRVPGRVWSVPDIVGVPPPVPVPFDHCAHLPVEETVGQSDEEPLERQQHIPDDDEYRGES